MNEVPLSQSLSITPPCDGSESVPVDSSASNKKNDLLNVQIQSLPDVVRSRKKSESAGSLRTNLHEEILSAVTKAFEKAFSSRLWFFRGLYHILFHDGSIFSLKIDCVAIWTLFDQCFLLIFAVFSFAVQLRDQSHTKQNVSGVSIEKKASPTVGHGAPRAKKRPPLFTSIDFGGFYVYPQPRIVDLKKLDPNVSNHFWR